MLRTQHQPEGPPAFTLDPIIPMKNHITSRRSRFFITIASVATLSVPALAQSTDTWSGTTGGDWVTAGNWTYSTGTGPVASGDSLVFGNTTTGSQTLGNTLTAGINIAGITFNAGTGTFVMTGNSFNLSTAAGITNSSGLLQTFSETGGITDSVSSTFAGNIAITTGLTDTAAAGLTTTSSSGTLTLGSFTLNSGATVAVTDTINGAGSVNITGPITNGSAFANNLAYTGSGTLTLGGANTYTGTTTLTTGASMININNASALGTGTVFLGGGVTINNTSGAAITSQANNPAITINGNTTLNFGTSAGTANNSLNLGTGAVSFNGADTIVLNGADALTLGGILTNTSTGALNLAVNNGSGTTSATALNLGGFALTSAASTAARIDAINGSGNINITGAVTDGAFAGSSLNYTGSGTLTLSGASTNTGSTISSSGTLAIGASSTPTSGTVVSGPLGAGYLIFNGGTIIAVGGPQTVANNMGVNNDAGGTIGGNQALTFSGILSLVTVAGVPDSGQHWETLVVNNTALTTFSGGIATGGQKMQFGGTGNILVSGAITDTGGGQFVAYQGTGSLTLSGANNYVDQTNVYQGTLVAGTNAPQGGTGVTGAFGNSTQAVTLGDNAGTNGSNGAQTGAAAIVTNGAFTIGRNITETNNYINSSLSIGGVQTTGTSTYTGNITLNPGTTATSTILTSAGSGNEVGGTVNFNDIISGAQNVTIGGGGIVQLNGANTFGSASNSITITGGTTLETPTATSSSSTAFGNANNELIFNNGIYQYAAGGTAFDLSATRTVDFASGGGTIDTNGLAITLANSIGNNDTGGLKLNDLNATPGSLTLSGSNTYTGGNTISSGTLIVNNATALGGTSGALAVNTGGALNLNGFNQTVGNLTGTGGTIYNNGSGTTTLTVGTGNGSGGAYAGVITNNTNAGTGITALAKNGTGTTTLNGANTYTGATSVNNGTLLIGASGSLGGTSVTLGGGALQVGALNSNAVARIGTAGQGSLTINAGGTLIFANGVSNAVSTTADNLNIGNTLTGTVALTFGGGGAIDFGVGGSTGSDEIALGSGLLASVSGSTTINLNVISALNGTSQELIAWGALPTGGGSFSLGTINGLGAGGFTLSLTETSAGLFLNESAVTSAYWKGSHGSSWATGLPGGSSNFTTDLAGTTNRAAALDSFTSVVFTATAGTNFANTTLDGNTTINNLTYNVGGVGIGAGTGGTLTITASGSGITVASGLGATTETISANVAIGANQTWTVNDAKSNLAVSGNVSGSGFGINKAGNGTLVLSGSNNTYSGATSVLAGALSIQSAGALNGTSGITVNNGAALQLAGAGFTTPATNLTINGTGVATAVSSGMANGGALENVSGNNTYSGTISLGSNASIGSDSGLLTLNAGSINNNGFTLTLTGAGNGELSSAINSGALTMSGTGTWTLDGANTYTGTTTVNSGTLQLGSSMNGTLGGGVGSSTPSPLTMTGGTVDLNGNGNGVIVGNLTGTGGTITNNASGTEVILYVDATSNGTFAGSITNGAAGTGLVDLYYNYNQGPFAAGSGITTLTGTNTFTGTGSGIFAGALRLANNSALGTSTSSPSALTVVTGAALQLSNNITTAAQVPLNLAGTGLSSGGALENFSGNNTYTGSITLYGDTSIGSDAGSTLNLASTATIGGNFNLTLVGSGNGNLNSAINLGTGSLTVSSSGTWTPTNTANANTTGTWTLNTPETYNGTSVTNGTLAYTSASVLANTGAITLGSTTASTTAALDYAGAGGTVSNALNFTGSQTILLSNTGTGSVTYSATPTFTGGAPLSLILGNATDTVGGSIGGIVDGGTGTNLTSLLKVGAANSTWILTGTNTYSGGTTINGGVLQIASGAALPNAANLSQTLILNGTSSASPAILQTSGTLNLITTGTGQDFTWGPNAGFSAIGGTLTITLNGGNQVSWGSNGFSGNGGAVLNFGSSTSNAQVVFTNNINLNTTDGFQQSISVAKGAGGDSTLLSGVISGGTTPFVAASAGPPVVNGASGSASGLTKAGAGTLILTNANNSYTGYTSIESGTLVAEASSTVTEANTTYTSTGVFGNGYGFYGAPAPTASYINIYVGNNQGGGTTVGGVTNPTVMVGSTTIGGSTSISNPVAIDWNNGTGQVFGIGGYTDSNNTFAGLVTLTNAAATGNTFAVTQVATTGTDALNITGGITSTNGGNINFANVGAVNVTTTGITDGGAPVSVTQVGSGTTTLAATNTYTGATTISAGTLNVTGSIVSAVSIASGAKLSGTGSTGAVLVNGGGILGLQNGSIGTLTVAGLSTGGTGTASSFTFDIGTNSTDLIADTGTLTLQGITTITLGNATGISALTPGLYNLITYAGTYTGSLSNFLLNTTSLDGQTLTLVQGNGVIELQVGNAAPSAGTAYFNGLGNDLNTAGNYDTSASSGTANTTALAAGTNVSFSANRNASTTPNISAPLEVNSVNFGSGTSGVQSGITVSSTNTADTLQIDATNANGNTAGNGITVASGSDTISAPVVLGGSQSWTAASGSSLNVSGQVSGNFALTKAGAGGVTLSNPTGNIYTGGTTVSAGTLFVANTSGSATGTGAVAVNSGGVLAGNGFINGAGVNINGGGSLISGSRSQISGTSLTTKGGMTLTNTPLTVGSGTGTANLTFDLAAGTSGINGGTASTEYDFSNPNNNTTYLSLNGSSSVNFAGTTGISLVDLTNTTGTNGSLPLSIHTAYLLMHGTSNTQYLNLVINSGTVANPIYSLSQNDAAVNGWVVGVYTSGAVNGTDVIPISITQYAADGVTLLQPGAGGVYPDAALYLDGGNLEVVPEPGTWALMIGGLALLIVIQRRRKMS